MNNLVSFYSELCECLKIDIKLLSEITNFIERDNVVEFRYTRDSNITKNLVYFIIINGQKYVIKIRNELSPLDYDMEINFIHKLINIDVIPIQYVYTKLNNNMISVEQFIAKSHLSQDELFSYLNILIRDISKVNSLEKMNFDENYFFFSFLKNKSLPLGIKTIEDAFISLKNNPNAIDYLNENENIIFFINNFLYSDLNEKFSLLFDKCYKRDILVFSLIDIHLGNFFISDEVSKFIDFEDISFCFIGFDLANLLIENIYCFTDEYPYFEFKKEKYYSEEFLLETFKIYINNYNQINKTCYQFFNIQQIYVLFCLSILKAIIEYLYMLNENIFMKKDIDFLLLIREKILNINFYINLISN